MQVPVAFRRFSRKSTQHRKLPFPASPKLRAAQVTPATSFDGVQPFACERWGELETYQPRVLVGPAADLQRLAQLVEVGTLNLRSVDHAIFVLTQCGDAPASDVSRVVFWQTFGVPVYELFMGRGGMLLACECELHEGWHAQTHAKFSVIKGELLVDAFGQPTLRTGLLGSIDTGACPCGRPGARLMDVEASGSKDFERELAATA